MRCVPRVRPARPSSEQIGPSLGECTSVVFIDDAIRPMLRATLSTISAAIQRGEQFFIGNNKTELVLSF